MKRWLNLKQIVERMFIIFSILRRPIDGVAPVLAFLHIWWAKIVRILFRQRCFLKMKRKLTKEHKRKIGLSSKGRIPWNKGLTKNTNEVIKASSIKSFETRKRLGLIGLKKGKPKCSEVKRGEKNPVWKGDKVKYFGLHSWLKRNKIKSKKCEKCGLETNKLDCSNISGEYKRDINDYEWLCRKCHMQKDWRKKNVKKQ